MLVIRPVKYVIATDSGSSETFFTQAPIESDDTGPDFIEIQKQYKGCSDFIVALAMSLLNVTILLSKEGDANRAD